MNTDVQDMYPQKPMAFGFENLFSGQLIVLEQSAVPGTDYSVDSDSYVLGSFIHGSKHTMVKYI